MVMFLKNDFVLELYQICKFILQGTSQKPKN